MEGRDRIDTDPRRRQLGRDCSKETHRFQRRMDFQRDHAAAKDPLDTNLFRLALPQNDGEPFRFPEGHDRFDAGRETTTVGRGLSPFGFFPIATKRLKKVASGRSNRSPETSQLRSTVRVADFAFRFKIA